MDKEYQYDVALSFAGEDRAFVEKVAHLLHERGVRVFYDKFEEMNLWGKNLYTHLSGIYRDKAKYTVIFISEFYAQKLWTNHERENAQARAFSENREYILPVRFDDTEIPGILKTVGYIDIRNYTAEKLSLLIYNKVNFQEDKGVVQSTSNYSSSSKKNEVNTNPKKKIIFVLIGAIVVIVASIILFFPSKKPTSNTYPNIDTPVVKKNDTLSFKKDSSDKVKAIKPPIVQEKKNPTTKKENEKESSFFRGNMNSPVQEDDTYKFYTHTDTWFQALLRPTKENWDNAFMAYPADEESIVNPDKYKGLFVKEFEGSSWGSTGFSTSLSYNGVTYKLTGLIARAYPNNGIIIQRNVKPSIIFFGNATKDYKIETFYVWKSR